MRRKWERWTADEIAYLRRLASQGKCRAEIAVILGRTKKQVAYKVELLKIRTRLPGYHAKWWTPEEIETAIRLRESGRTCKEIGAELGRSAQCVNVMLLRRRVYRARRPKATRKRRRREPETLTDLEALIAEQMRHLPSWWKNERVCDAGAV